jgi:hypothetical protein
MYSINQSLRPSTIQGILSNECLFRNQHTAFRNSFLFLAVILAIQENPLSHVIFQRFDSFGLLKKGLVFKGTTQFSGDA